MNQSQQLIESLGEAGGELGITQAKALANQHAEKTGDALDRFSKDGTVHSEANRKELIKLAQAVPAMGSKFAKSTKADLTALIDFFNKAKVGK